MPSWQTVEEFDEDAEIPWADPAIRLEYEAALGRLILSHNELDLHLTLLIECCLKRLGNPPPLEKLRKGAFGQRLENLLMLDSISEGLQLKSVSFSRISELNRLRNIVAHGHFEQNPYDGEYSLVTNKRSHKDFSTNRLDEITAGLKDEVEALQPLIWFYEPFDMSTFLVHDPGMADAAQQEAPPAATEHPA